MQEDLRKILDSLYEAIKHGDEEHQQWLKDKIDEFYNHLEDIRT